MLTVLRCVPLVRNLTGLSVGRAGETISARRQEMRTYRHERTESENKDGKESSETPLVFLCAAPFSLLTSDAISFNVAIWGEYSS